MLFSLVKYFHFNNQPSPPQSATSLPIYELWFKYDLGERKSTEEDVGFKLILSDQVSYSTFKQNRFHMTGDRILNPRNRGKGKQ